MEKVKPLGKLGKAYGPRLKTFQVPVWFNIAAEDQEHAWRKIADLMDQHLFMQDYVVNEPVEIKYED